MCWYECTICVCVLWGVVAMNQKSNRIKTAIDIAACCISYQAERITKEDKQDEETFEGQLDLILWPSFLWLFFSFQRRLCMWDPLPLASMIKWIPSHNLV